MAIKLFISDLDDSLIRHDRTLSPRMESALDALRAHGVAIALASGRMYCAMERYMKQLHVTIPAIAYNGAMLFDPAAGKAVSNTFIPNALALEAISEAESRGLHIQAFDDKGYFYPEENDYSTFYRGVCGITGMVTHTPMSEYVDFDPAKLIIIDAPEHITQLLGEFQAKFGKRLEINISKPMYLEITNPAATKGQALLRLCELLGIAPHEVIACGDGLNDMDMIEAAGLGVVVCNARAAVQQIADVITPTNDEDGIAQLIESMLGNGTHTYWQPGDK